MTKNFSIIVSFDLTGFRSYSCFLFINVDNVVIYFLSLIVLYLLNVSL